MQHKITFSPPQEAIFDVKCVECRSVVDTIPFDEVLQLIEYLTKTNKIVLCFDCERKAEIMQQLKAVKRGKRPWMA